MLYDGVFLRRGCCVPRSGSDREHQAEDAGRAIQQIYHVDFFNQSGVCVAECDSWCFRTERDTAREQGTKYNKIREASEKRYSQQELDDIFQNYANANLFSRC